MKRLLLLFLASLTVCIVFGRHEPHWLRYCAISPDGRNIAFSYKGNLYRVSAAGGEAKALTLGAAYNFMPVWSHDGRYISFASNRFGNFDIFILPAEGGEARRLTWHTADEYPYDFNNDDQKVLFGAVRMDAASNRQFPSEALQELYEVPVSGGRVEQILTTSAEDAKMSPDGKTIVYHDRKGRENPWRKHQVSSVARDIWLYDIHKKTHLKLTSFRGEDRSPVFAGNGDGIYYLSEESGSFNIHERSLKNPFATDQITQFKKYPVRFLSASKNNTICFGYNGDIYLKKPNTDPVKLRVTINERDQSSEPCIPIAELTEMALSPNGLELAFIFRGEVFVSAMDGNHIKQITHTAASEAGLSFSPDGRSLLYASERRNRWDIYQSQIVGKNETCFFAAALLKESPLIYGDQENYQPEYSPDGKEIAFIENRTSLKIFNLATQQSRTLLNGDQLYSRRDFDQYFKWSPDSRWLLLQYNVPGTGNDEVGIVSADGKSGLKNVSQSGFSDSHPKWMMDGKMMMWFTDRNGLHSYANSSSRQNDVYAAFLNRKDWEQYKLNGAGEATKEPLDEWHEKTDTADKNRMPIDWEGMQTGKLRLSLQSALLEDALLDRNGGILYYLSRMGKNYDLWMTDLHTKETKMLCPLNIDEGNMQWDEGQKNIFLLGDGHIIRIDPLTGKREFIPIKGEMALNAAKERKAMFEHLWRRVKETFYEAGMHGTDWDAYKAGYEKYLPDINNNYDFAEMLNELLGELNTSHTGIEYHDTIKGKETTASLGLFYNNAYQDSGVQIEEIIREGPLDNPLYDIKPGMVIESIDGKAIAADVDFAKYLNGKAGKNTLLLIRDGSRTKEISVIPVKPEEEENLLYQRWVKRNEEETDLLSDDKIGYVHLYRMNDAAYRNTYESVLGKFAGRKALIVDTRFNRGGDLASELTMFLSGINTRINTTDHFMVSGEPSFRWTKPSIVLANEANYSDGSCFVYDYHHLNMGKWVGMPVPGSCTFQTGQSLQDNTLRWSTPTLGVKDPEGHYLENQQSEPDILQMNEYDQVAVGRDQQLEEAIRQLLISLNQASPVKSNKSGEP